MGKLFMTWCFTPSLWPPVHNPSIYTIICIKYNLYKYYDIYLFYNTYTDTAIKNIHSAESLPPT